MNYYEDSEYRYTHDAEFRNAVDMLQALAMQHGFTPGELKQIAFYASLRIEELRRPPLELPEGWNGGTPDSGS